MMKNAERSEELTPLDSAIERYVAGDMSVAERAAFEQMVAKSAEAKELLAAERLVQQYAIRTPLSAMPVSSAVPSAAVLSHLKNTRPRKLWVSYVAGVSYALVLAAVICFMFSNRPVNIVPAQHAPAVSVSPTQAPTLPEIPSTTVLPPATNSHVAATPKAAAPKKSTEPEIVEPVGPPKVFDKDNAHLKVHSN
jgi:hypothetical protein